MVKFVLFTDSVDGAMAAVDQDTDDPTDWVLSVDIAESWTCFCPQGQAQWRTIAEAKVFFFYEWPELTKLRAQIIPRTYSRLRRE